MIRLLLACVLTSAAFTAAAQTAARVPRIGVPYIGAPSQSQGPTSGFDKGMRELGYVPGCNVNLKVARALGLTVPQSLLLRADRFVE